MVGRLADDDLDRMPAGGIRLMARSNVASAFRRCPLHIVPNLRHVRACRPRSRFARTAYSSSGLSR